MIIPTKNIHQIVIIMKAQFSVRITKCIITYVKKTNFALQSVKSVIHICMIVIAFISLLHQHVKVVLIFYLQYMRFDPLSNQCLVKCLQILVNLEHNLNFQYFLNFFKKVTLRIIVI